MALVFTGYVGKINVIDNGGNKRPVEVRLTGDLADAAAALTKLQAVMEDYVAITDAVVYSYTLTQVYEESALSLPASGVQVENTAVISARILSSEEKYATIRVLAPKIGIFTGASGKAANVVDPNDADLVAYLTHFTQGLGGGGGVLVSDGESIAIPTSATISGKRVHVGSRKG